MSVVAPLRAVMVAAVAGSALVAVRAQPAVQQIVGEGLNQARHGCATGSTQPLSLLRPAPSRSPGGLLYERPAPPAARWWIDGCAELGVLAGDDERSAQFRPYRDLDAGAVISVFSLTAEAPGGARFLELGGGNTGRHDQYYSLRLGRHNEWSFATFYNETPHLLSDSFRTLWNGVGSAALTLASPVLVPGGRANDIATQAALRDVLAGTPATTLQIVRKKGGFGFDARLTDSWRAFVSWTSERRHGARPSGAVFGGGDGGGNVEVPQSVDDSYNEIAVGASYADPLTSVNIGLSAALFRNHVGTMTFENPLRISPSSIAGIDAGAFSQGRFALDPDNDHTSARLDMARSVPGWSNARFTASFAFGRTRQNEPLLAPTSMALTGATLNGIAADGLWNTAAALTRGRADARIDTRLAVLTASVQPARTLSLTARYRDDSTDNDAVYQACNPQTGQLGRLLNDGSGAALVDVPQYLAAHCDLARIRALGITPDAGDITLRNTPFEQRSRSFEVSADWRASRSASLTTEFEHRETRRSWRERERTSDDRVKVSYTERGFAGATVRASLEYAERGGSEYRGGAGAERRSASLGPFPSTGNVSSWFGTVDQLRKFDLADRTRTTVRLRTDFAIGDDFDAGVDFTGRYARYPRSEVGRDGSEQQHALGFDANYVAADGIHLHGFYSFQDGRMHQVGAQPAGCLIGVDGVTTDNVQQCGAFGGPLFPRDRSWEARSRDRNHVVGAGGRFEFRWGVVDFEYTYVRGRTSIDYAYGTGILLSPARTELAGSGWPDLRFRHSVLAAGAWLPLTHRASMRLRLQVESGQVDDWHYDGIAANPVPLPNTVYLNSAPQPYRAIFGGILLRLAL